MKRVKEEFANDIVATNNVNSTIELTGVGCGLTGSASGNALLFFDLADSSIMTLAVVKVEHVNFIRRLRLKFSRISLCNGYVCSTASAGNRTVVVTFLRKNIYDVI